MGINNNINTRNIVKSFRLAIAVIKIIQNNIINKVPIKFFNIFKIFKTP